MFLIIASAFSSCHKHFYTKEIEKYLDELGVSYATQFDIIYIVPLEGCQTCINNALVRISQQESNQRVSIIFIGSYVPSVVRSNSNLSVYLDSTYIRNKYQTNLFEPSRVRIRNGKLSVDHL